MKNIVSPVSLSFIKETIEYVSGDLKFSNFKQGLWLIFGSYVINRNGPGSDLDLIVIDDFFKENKRSVFNFKNVPIHFIGINMKTLKDDGKDRLYGSYFSGKVINPHIFLYGNKTLENIALNHAGKFVAPLAGYLSKLTRSESLTDSQVTSLVFIAYLSTDPSFDSYFLNYFVSPNFENIWTALCEATIKMLISSKTVQESNRRYYFTEKFIDYKSFHIERMKISARHWSYGAVCHGGDRTFQDTIFTKAKQKMERIDPLGNKYTDMVNFLKKQSGLSEIYI